MVNHREQAIIQVKAINTITSLVHFPRTADSVGPVLVLFQSGIDLAPGIETCRDPDPVSSTTSLPASVAGFGKLDNHVHIFCFGSGR